MTTTPHSSRSLIDNGKISVASDKFLIQNMSNKIGKVKVEHIEDENDNSLITELNDNAAKMKYKFKIKFENVDQQEVNLYINEE